MFKLIGTLEEIHQKAIEDLKLVEPQEVQKEDSKYKDYLIAFLEYKLAIANFTVGWLLVTNAELAYTEGLKNGKQTATIH